MWAISLVLGFSFFVSGHCFLTPQPVQMLLLERTQMSSRNSGSSSSSGRRGGACGKVALTHRYSFKALPQACFARPAGGVRFARSPSNGGDEEASDDADQKPAQRGAFGSATAAAGQVWRAILSLSLLVSLVLAANSLYTLKTTPLTVGNVGSTVSYLLPLAGFGYLGALRLFGLVARVVRVLLTVPVVVGGTYYFLPHLPAMLQHSDKSVGSVALVSLVATPEVFEAIALLAILLSSVVWLLGKAKDLAPVVKDRAGEED